MKPDAVGRVRFERGYIIVDVDRDAFGASTILARINARSLHPLTTNASDPSLFELVDLSAAYYALDRFVGRAPDRWTRKFIIHLPVIDRSLWDVKAPLVREWLLALTNDDVEIVPILWDGPGDPERHDRSPVMQLEQPIEAVGLVSDGLDSLCGVDAQSTRRMAWASVLSGHRGKRIAETLQLTNKRLHYSIRLDLAKGNSAKEKTQRSRTVLAIAMGMTLARALDSNIVECYENGIGILNLPVPNLQYGAMASQVLQPSYLPLWDRVARAFFHQNIELRFPNRFRTKAEMLQDLTPKAVGLVPSTFSCDAEVRQSKGRVVHCGVCGSCRFRQIAMLPNRVQIVDAVYSFGQGVPARVDPAEMLVYHSGQIRIALESSDPWASLTRLQPELVGVDQSDNARISTYDRHVLAEHQRVLREKTIALLGRHVAEVTAWNMDRNAA